ncbi:MAG: hypothetical protein K0M40_22495 [Prolixibacteraceae bacterium]|nr:hypothetical protein [Prolixibacteraceae bacterium]
MEKEPNAQTDLEKLLLSVTSLQFQNQLTPELKKSKANQELLHKAKWQLFDDQIQKRIGLINGEITFWKDQTPTCNIYLVKTYASVKPILDIWAEMKPITDKMIVDFIEGWAMSRFTLLPLKLTTEEDDEIIKLLQPPVTVFKEFLSSTSWQEYLVNRCIPETKTIITRFNSFQEDTVNERDAILSFIRDKKAMPFNKEQVDMLKMEYLKNQNQFVDEYRKLTNESGNEPGKIRKKPGRKASVAKPVIDLIIGMDDKYKDIFLSDLKRDIKCNEPVELVFMLRALVELGYVYQGVRRELFLSFLTFYGKEPDFVSISGQNDDWIRKNKELLDRMKNFISIIIEKNIIT